jgi:hypothetical protein
MREEANLTLVTGRGLGDCSVCAYENNGHHSEQEKSLSQISKKAACRLSRETSTLPCFALFSAPSRDVRVSHRLACFCLRSNSRSICFELVCRV